MPLLDHFHPPISERRHWEGFLSGWAAEIAAQINAMGLPEQYVAEPTIHIGGHVQIDVATFSEETDSTGNGAHRVGTLTQSPVVTAPPWVIPAEFPDTFEVHIFNSDGGIKLAAAIELVSPANKDRPESRRVFAAECANFLSQGIPFIVMDIVTNRLANLHNETMELLQRTNFLLPAETRLYATAYRPVRRDSREEIDAWYETLTLDEPLPKLPLYLDVDLACVLDFEATYQETCKRLRVSKPK